MEKNKKILLLFATVIFFVLILVSGSGNSSDYTCKYSAVGEICGELGAHCGNADDPACCSGSRCIYNMCMAKPGTSCSNSDECNGPCENNVIDCQSGECCGRHHHPCQNNVPDPQRDAPECCEGFHCHIRDNGYNYCERDHYCGDGRLNSGEECDDGNDNNLDECRNDCTLPYCGDEILDSDEQCDDGNNVGGDGCSSDCKIEEEPYCGDGILDAGEECELPNTFNNNFCSQSTSKCSGNKLGVRDAYGNCDSECGCINDPFVYSCVVEQCGAECVLDSDCDDENPHTLDTCNIESCGCEYEELPYCGDGNLDAGEECELPDTFNNNFCSQTTSKCFGNKLGVRDAYGNCDSECGCINDPFKYACVVGQCGAECTVDSDCDDENPHTLDTCNTQTCGCEYQEEPYCGDGNLDAGEECDDGNNIDGDGCSSDCKIECGDVGIKYSYDNSYGTGIAIKENTVWISETPAKLTKGEDHEIKYYIRNNIANTTNNIHVIVKIDNDILSEYNTLISKYHYKIVDLDISQLECSSSHLISVEVEKINETDCNPEDNYAEREIIVICEPPQPHCGDGIVNIDLGEECDNGVINGENCIPEYGGSCNYCSEVCTIETIEGGYCGDGEIQEPYEECEINTDCSDCNPYTSDRCVACRCEYIEEPYCGDGNLDAGEECDDGNNDDGDGCSSTCVIELPEPYCGNGILDSGEECDDGNNVSGDGCSSECQLENGPCCGNGVIEIGEECDDGGNNGVECDNSEHGCNYCSLSCEIIHLKGPENGDDDDDFVGVECGNWSACVGGTQTRVCYEIYGHAYSSKVTEKRTCIQDFVPLMQVTKNTNETISFATVEDTGSGELGIGGIIFIIILALLIFAGIVFIVSALKGG